MLLGLTGTRAFMESLECFDQLDLETRVSEQQKDDQERRETILLFFVKENGGPKMKRELEVRQNTASWQTVVGIQLIGHNSPQLKCSESNGRTKWDFSGEHVSLLKENLVK